MKGLSMKNFKPITLQKKILLTFSFIIMTNTIVGAYYSIHMSNTISVNEIAQKSYHDTLELSHAFKSANELMKVYMRSGDFATFVLYKENCTFIEEKLLLLKVTSSNLEEQGLIRAINNAIDSTFHYYGLAIFNYQNNIPNYFVNYYQGNKIANYGIDYFDQYLNLLLGIHTSQVDLIQKQTDLAFTIAQSILIICGFIYLILAVILSRWLTTPVTNLVEAAKKISRGDYDFPDLPIKNYDELGDLTATFNIMKEDIRLGIEILTERVEIERKLREVQLREATNSTLLKEAQYLALQSQMNPHFLFNTLNAISRTIEYESKEVAINLVYSLATICRYNLDRVNTLSTIKDEIYVTNQYIYIQQHRFGERIKYLVDCEPSCSDALVPSLLIQPLVENALKHGIENMVSGGMIYVKIVKRKNSVYIRVYDNGVGLEKERLALLLKNIECEECGHTTGIGLGNVINRIKLMEDSNISIKSSKTRGTLIKIYLPYKGENNV